jgi:hypothetical protein
MPVPLIPCRLKDDHSVTHMIGQTALTYFPDWEPIPTRDTPLPEPEPVAPKPVPKKAAVSAAKDKE